MVSGSLDAPTRWRAELAEWAIPEEILAAAPESPWGAPPECFPPPSGDEPDTPSRRRAREAIPPGGTVLDVGCGAGAAGLALVPPAGRVVGVDESPQMRTAFTAAAAERGVDYTVVQGHWPEVAAAVGEAVGKADVVVAHHVTYNVPDLVPFARALDEHAERRVVLEMTALHPLVSLAPLWRHFHDLDRPSGPSAELCRDVLESAGYAGRMERFIAPARQVRFTARVAFTRKRLCLPADREAEVATLLREQDSVAVRELVTLWWDTGDQAYRHSR